MYRLWQVGCIYTKATCTSYVQSIYDVITCKVLCLYVECPVYTDSFRYSALPLNYCMYSLEIVCVVIAIYLGGLRKCVVAASDDDWPKKLHVRIAAHMRADR